MNHEPAVLTPETVAALRWVVLPNGVRAMRDTDGNLYVWDEGCNYRPYEQGGEA